MCSTVTSNRVRNYIVASATYAGPNIQYSIVVMSPDQKGKVSVVQNTFWREFLACFRTFYNRVNLMQGVTLCKILP